MLEESLNINILCISVCIWRIQKK